MDEFRETNRRLSREMDRLDAGRARQSVLQQRLKEADEYVEEREEQCREFYEQQGLERDKIDEILRKRRDQK